MNRRTVAVSNGSAAPAGGAPRRIPAALVLCAGLLAACLDGYPPKQDMPAEAAEMSEAQRLQAMNIIGRRAAGGQTWVYHLADPCSLQVEMRGRAGAGITQHVISLADMKPMIDFDDELRVFEVRMGAGTLEDETTSILKAASWTDASFLHSVLLHLQQDCR